MANNPTYVPLISTEVDSDFTITGHLTVNGDITSVNTSDIAANGNVSCGRDLAVIGASTLNTANVQGSMTVLGDATVMGNSTSMGNHSVGANIVAQQSISTPMLKINEGTNARMGTVAVNGTTPVNVATTALTASSRVFLTIDTPGGTPGLVWVATRTPGTGFSITSVALNTSTVAWLIVEPA